MISRLLILFSLFALVGVHTDCMAITGSWRGDLTMGPTKLPLVFNFNEGADGLTAATMDSPRQNAKDIPLEVVFISADSINVQCSMIGASFSGRITDGEIKGTFSQSGFVFPLTLLPDQDINVRRPQTPRAPFPYSENAVTFHSSDGTPLAGTLTIPEGNANEKVPIVIMVTGSGPQNRDEEIFEHRPFAVIADYLARNGIASFRYDDRGVAESKGNYSAATIDTLTSDALSAYKYIRSLKRFGKTGILGHSEGGALAIMIAAQEKPDFIISMAGAAIPAKEIMLEQNIRSLNSANFSDASKEASVKLLQIIFDTIQQQHRTGSSETIDADKICRENNLEVPAAVLQSVRNSLKARNPYFDSLVSLDPTEAMKKIKCPVLAINGTKDTQVNADTNLEAFRKYVKGCEIHKMEGLNHLMQHAATGDVSEYNDLTETISPEVLEIFRDFIRQLP